MTLRGLLAFYDPTKPGAAEAIEELAQEGVTVRLVTGDNRLAARKVATDVGLGTGHELTGDDIDRLDDAAMVDAVARTAVFAEVEPIHTELVVMLVLRTDRPFLRSRPDRPC
jgi:P-type Mg2+ transporter